MNKKTTLFAIWTAMGGLLLQGIGIAWAICLYNQQHPLPYSFSNHFVSELGAPHFTMMAKVFNQTNIVCAPLVFLMLVALAAHLRNKLSILGAIAGFCATFGLIGVGIFPMDSLRPHLVGAMMYFWGWLFTVSFFTAAFLRRYSFKKSPTLVITGFLVIACCLSFLSFLTKWTIAMERAGILQKLSYEKMHALHRPVVWDIAILEWSVVFSIALWNLAIFFYLLRSEKGQQQS